MKLNHSKIKEKDMIENYVLGKLNAEEESAFEEHILNCAECRRKCELLETIITGSEHRLIEEDNTLKVNKTKKITLSASYKILLRVAAAIVILAGAAYLIINTGKLHPTDGKNQSVADHYMMDTMNKSTSNSSAVSSDKIKKQEPEQEEYELIARTFEPSPVFETAIRDQVRGHEITVSSPADSAVLQKKQEIDFIWDAGSEEEIILILRKNTGKVILKENVQSPYSRTIDLPGLYYWQLSVHNEVIYTGRFLVK